MVRERLEVHRGLASRRQTARSSSSLFSRNSSAWNSTKVPSSKEDPPTERPDLGPQPSASGDKRFRELELASSVDTQPSKRRRRQCTNPPSEELVDAAGYPKASSHSSRVNIDSSDNELADHSNTVLRIREKMAAIIKAIDAMLEEIPDVKSKGSSAEFHHGSAEHICELFDSARGEGERYKRMVQSLSGQSRRLGAS
ncbi:hypothetical protein DL98DRAFT_661901 [Cadophora sp. DSE1049]|nr:hypothetical protein DL98DRAFT_661901 [Cadophora sp. DSE1049]